MKRHTTLTLAIALSTLTACAGNQGEDTKGKPDAAAKPNGDAAKAPDAAKTEPTAEAPAAKAYVLDAIADLAAGGPVRMAETKAYGCGVKYADAGGEPQAKVGEAAPAFSLPDLDGKPVALADFAGKTVVLEWFNPDCPFVKYAHGDGPLKDMAKQQSQAGVVWLAINSGAAGKQGNGVERNREAKQEWAMEHPILIDEDGTVGHSYGAATTPHMFVINPEGKLVYAGGLDNAPLGRIE